VTLVLFATSVAAGYALLCWVRPFGRCRVCSRTGVRLTLILRRFRSCWWCKGAGLRLRVGRRAYNYLARVRNDARTAARARDAR
jgi:hypothetical protein